jgi:hypothetical protein
MSAMSASPRHLWPDERLSLGERAADRARGALGSWPFMAIVAVLVGVAVGAAIGAGGAFAPSSAFCWPGSRSWSCRWWS